MSVIARIDNTKQLSIVGSIVEYPSVLESAGRNLLSGSGEVRPTSRTLVVSTYEDLYEYVDEEVMVYFDLKINEGGVLRTILSACPYQNNGVSVANSTHALPTKKGVWQRFGRKTFIKDWGDNNPAWTKGAIAFHDSAGENDYEVRNIKIEKGSTATPWTPAPEDLGLIYPDNVQYFSFGFKSNGDLYTNQVIKSPSQFSMKNDGVTNSITVSEIIENAVLS